MFLSPFTPLFFSHHKRDGIDSIYVQTFAPTDEILIELIDSEKWIGAARVFAEPGHKELFKINWNQWQINGSSLLKFTVMSLEPGYYSIEIDDIGTSNIFRITDDPLVLKNTTLIQYSMDNNRHRQDAVFFIDHMQHFFSFRVPGGFKDSNRTFAVDGEQFVTPTCDIVQLFGVDSMQQKFTLGNGQGCPVWFAELLNRLLCCSYVYFDGVRYTRKDNSAPETTVLLDGVNSFVFTQNLQRVINIDPALELSHRMIMRGVDRNIMRSINDNVNRLIN